ncbi:MAG: aminotransferase class I/II-fold pyridoxal phosphate-dependent enzyme, partial [Candidatus Bathyarchaeia archaeon]
VMLFPQPLQAAKKAVKEYDGFIAYDAAHVLGLIAGGCFQDPLREGADVVTGSTHKTFPGPQGGLILSTKNLAEGVNNAVFPGLVSNHHLHRLAALAVALAEMKAFAKDYARDTINNAKTLAKALHECGFHVLGRNKGFTESHQVLLEVSGLGGGDTVAKKLESANIVSNKNLLPYDKLKNALNPSGLRLGTQEVTRLGMGPSEMTAIAELFKALLLEGKDPNQVALGVEKLVKDSQTVKYSFDSQPDAYRYFDLH